MHDLPCFTRYLSWAPTGSRALIAVASLDSHIWDDVGESFGEARAVTTRRVFVTHAVTP
jgi:hypothetical protein